MHYATLYFRTCMFYPRCSSTGANLVRPYVPVRKVQGGAERNQENWRKPHEVVGKRKEVKNNSNTVLATLFRDGSATATAAAGTIAGLEVIEPLNKEFCTPCTHSTGVRGPSTTRRLQRGCMTWFCLDLGHPVSLYTPVTRSILMRACTLYNGASELFIGLREWVNECDIIILSPGHKKGRGAIIVIARPQ